MKYLIASMLLCFCLITASTAANRYNNDIRSMPFIEMMVTMMKIMNHIMGGGSNNFSAFNSLPYSPAFMPGIGSGLGGLGTLPMSPSGFNNIPFSNLNTAPNLWQDDFQTGKNVNNFWNPNRSDNQELLPDKELSVKNQTLNGIWQDFSGDVIAIYNNNRFIWSDGKARNLAGQLAIKGNTMMAYIPAMQITLRFQFYMEPGQFVVRDQSSRIYTFKRIH